MCGIAGIVRTDQGPVDRDVVAAMGESLRHRGPDDHGVHVANGVGLAHRRLSIIDLSAAGHQPMANEDGSVWIVFNGEIYNFQELRQALRPHHVLRSRTDTEVILHLYEDYGLRCIPMLRGMFAFAIWDAPARRLVLVRDRLGKKPLFYRADEQGLSFASELKALLAAETLPDIDPVALHHYLTFQYVPAPLTIFKGIRKLLPGHLLVYEDGKATDSVYWSLQYNDKLTRASEDGYLEEFRSLLDESVRLRLISDVPLGAFLSGGVDSSTIVALMSRHLDQPVKTFSIGFADDTHNELPYAREIAQRFGTDHHEFVVEPSALDILPTLVRVYDEPYADSSAIPTYYVSELSRRHVTVILNGDGGDELFAGYPRYALTALDRFTDRRLSPRRRHQVMRLLAALPDGVPGVGRVRSRLERGLAPFSRVYLGRICYFHPFEKEWLYTPEFFASVRECDSYELLDRWFTQAQARDLLDRLLEVDTRTYLPDDLLVKVDRATMAHALEARSPLLDHRLVEFAAALPVTLKIKDGEGKYLFKRAMRGVLPDGILNRPKRGFAVPIDRWFREDCREFVRDMLLAERAVGRGYFRPDRVRHMIEVHQQGQTNYGSRLFALLMLELWHREYVDGRQRLATH
jgi:asparagine synthase (glutamine-hydrolysing)